jgi:hypothetical protein
VCRFHIAAGTVNHEQTIFWRLAKVSWQQPSEVVSFSYWSIKLWFHTEGKLTIVLIIPSSWGFLTGHVRHQDCFLASLPWRKRISTRGVSHFQSLYFVIVLLSFFTLFYLHLVYQKYKILVPFIVDILLLYF